MIRLTIEIEETPENLETIKSLLSPVKAESPEPVTEINVTQTGASNVACGNTGEGTINMAMAKPEKPAAEVSEVTKEALRAKAMALIKSGKPDAVNKVFASFGVAKLKDLKEEDYVACMEKLAEV